MNKEIFSTEKYGVEPILIKDLKVRCFSETGETMKSLTLKLQFEPKVVSESMMIMELFDDEDPLFLYQSKLTEEDFKLMKLDQNLIVDFYSFPTCIVDLVEQCSGPYQPSGFSVRFQLSNFVGHFSVVETFKYREISHINIKLLKADDFSLKSHIALKFQQCRREYIAAMNRLNSYENQMNTLSNDILRVRQSHESEINTLRSTHNAEIQHLKLQLSLSEERQQKQKELIEKLKAELHISNRRAAKIIKQMKSYLTELSSLKKSKREGDAELLQQKDEVRRLAVKKMSLREKITEIRDEKEKLLNLLEESEGRRKMLKQKMKGVLGRLKEDEQAVAELTKNVKDKNDACKMLQQKIESLRRELEKKSSTIQSQRRELQKNRQIAVELEYLRKLPIAKLKESMKAEQDAKLMSSEGAEKELSSFAELKTPVAANEILVDTGRYMQEASRKMKWSQVQQQHINVPHEDEPESTAYNSMINEYFATSKLFE